MLQSFTPLRVALVLALCSSSALAKEAGSAQFTVSVPASPGAAVSRVTVTVTAPGVPPRSVELTATEDVWTGTLDAIPPGPERAFRAQAFDAANKLLSEDSVSVTLAANKTKRITLELEPAASAPAVQHAPPQITQASQSLEKVAPGKLVAFKATAKDPKKAALTFQWSASTGTLSEPTSDATRSSVSWIASGCASPTSPATITLTVTNAFQRTAQKVFTVTGLPPCPAGWTPTASLAAARAVHAAVVLPDGKVLVTGGDSVATRYLPSAELYDPTTGTWSLTPPMAEGHAYHPALLLPDGKVLVAGGTGKSGNSSRKSELYDPATGTWSPTGDMTRIRTAYAAVVLPDGRVLAAGGHGSNHLTAAELYDPASGTWSPTAPMASARLHPTATLLSTGKVLVTGGEESMERRNASAELYDPASGTWSSTGTMAQARSQHAAVRLPNGKVLVMGGADGDSVVLASVELYDPATGTWSPTGTMAQARRNAAALLLPNGKVLVLGGYDGKTSLATAELYDPAAGTWGPAPAMASARSYATASPLPNGKVLVSGGTSDTTLGSAELYTP